MNSRDSIAQRHVVEHGRVAVGLADVDQLETCHATLSSAAHSIVNTRIRQRRRARRSIGVDQALDHMVLDHLLEPVDDAGRLR